MSREYRPKPLEAEGLGLKWPSEAERKECIAHLEVCSLDVSFEAGRGRIFNEVKGDVKCTLTF